ncbi:MAG: OmpA family protein [Salinivirgaceae bacterium]
MNKKLSKILIGLLFFLFSQTNVKAQFYFLEDSYDQLQLEFLRKKIETNKGETFFNVVSVKNPSNRPVEVIVKFSYPAQWSFFGESQQRLTLAANDSILLPFRASVSTNVKGDIGYAIVASITDLKGNAIKNEYSFITVPKIQNVLYTPLKRVVYTNKNNYTTNIEFFIANNGNTDEFFYLDVNLDQALRVGNLEERFYRESFSLKALSDTLIVIPITLMRKLNYDNKFFHRISTKTYTQDTSFYSTIWLKELKSATSNQIPDDYKMASFTLFMHDLFKEDNPTFSLSLYGNLLFKNKNQNLFYYLQGNGRNFASNPWKYSKMYVTYTRPKYTLTVGDIFESIGQSSFGRGFAFKFKTRNTYLNSFFSTSMITDKQVVGLSLNQQTPLVNVGLGGSYAQDITANRNTLIGQFSVGKSINKIGSFKFNMLTSFKEHTLTNEKMPLGYSGSINYSNTYYKTKFYLSSIYGDNNYGGNNAGRLQINSRIIRAINNKVSSSFNYYQINYAPPRYLGDSLLPSSFNNYNKSEFLLYSSIGNNIRYSAGVNSLGKASNQFIGPDGTFEFSTRSYQLKGNLRYKNSSSNGSYNLAFEGGLVNVIQYDKQLFDTLSINKNWISYQLSTNFNFRLWSLFLSYNNGPNSIHQQYSYFASNYFTKYVRVMPSFDIPIIPGSLRLQTNLNYSFDVNAKVNRLNMTNNMIANLGDTWELVFSASLIFQSNYDQVLDSKYSYSGTYFEIGLRKDFLINQPRYQYHNLDVYFFKDFNGNGIKDDGEPGLSGILFEIQRDDVMTAESQMTAEGNFMPTELISDLDGHIQYNNIPNGFYLISYLPTTEIQGSFSSEVSSQSIYLGKNEKLYIPFTENNKIFGRVLLNRSKLSNLGAIDISNIKVTAENSNGRRYSTLTDAQGNFTIYVPSVDNYKVRVNNIFFENFELEQNDYEVQLNGYRQFEVNFIFNEKKRKINFTASYDYGSRLDGPGVEIVRRTNLAGTIKDATTLQPIAATIRIIDGQGNEITSANSNAKTGVFTTSFIAGDDYNVEVMADDYWFYAEKLYSNQIVTFKNLKKDILIKAITVGSIIPMNTLNFNSGSAEIPATSFPELERLLKVLRKNPSVKIDVHGHADDLEIRETQEDLALERAKIIAKYLIANGYNRVKYTGHANTKPIAENDTETGRAQNRRVEIVVTGK